MREQQFANLYKEYSRQLYNFIRWTTGYSSMSDDIFQNVFIKIWRIDSFPVDPVECKRLMYTIARNACIDFFRSSARFSTMQKNYKFELENSVDEPIDSGIWKELSKLPETDRSILYLHVKEGYAYKEIGVLLDMNENQIRVKAFRALKKLRNEIDRKEL